MTNYRSLFMGKRLLLWVVIFFVTNDSLAAVPIHHDITLILKPLQSELVVVDTITTASASAQSAMFILNDDLEIQTNTVRLTKQSQLTPPFDKLAKQADVPVAQYNIVFTEDKPSFSLKYKGKLHYPINISTISTRSFSETPGLITDKGVFLAGSTLWYPVFSDRELITFTLHIEVPKSWNAITQGVLQADRQLSDKRILRWTEKNPQDDIYVVASRYHEYRQTMAHAEAMVFLRHKDEALAQRYLDSTGQYITLYTTLLGPYPYKKFALVENFWETGYGMPSFTLLGSRVIRLPFILHSSYPHEILHNYWGNGVYVDDELGNWAEGLTAYLADHLIQEQRGNGSAYRRDILQKYTDFVNREQDFPLTDFRARHNSVSEAVGYGKAMMLFHMLRMQLGHQDFIQALRNFYKQYRFNFASFNELEQIFSDTSNQDLKFFFEQWVQKTGAPQLTISEVKHKKQQKAGYLLYFTLNQIQKSATYELNVPVVVHLENPHPVFQKMVSFKARQASFSFTLPARPLQVEIDPQFDIFRRLDSREIPSAISQGFGDANPLIVLPSKENKTRLAAYQKLVKQWQKMQPMELTDDSQLTSLPTDRTVWLLGFQNEFKETVISNLSQHGIAMSEMMVTIQNEAFDLKNHSILLSSRHPNNIDKTLLWLGSENINAIPGLTRKLPHYGKYSYLVFQGDAPDNRLKGQWKITDSPMQVIIDENNNQTSLTKLPVRQPLAVLPPAFSPKNMLQDIRYLADPARKGRGLGTVELDDAANYIANMFKQAGLKPGGDNGYFQTWSMDVGKPLGKITLKNVIGILPGTHSQLTDTSVVVSAHYDHLGLGWPDVHQGDEGKIHSGADDNASGVAVMLELARRVANTWKPARSIIFIAFTGEETNRLGSKHYVKQITQYPAKQVFTAINLDTVGRLNNNPVTVLGVGSATELIHIFQGAGFVTGIEVKPVIHDVGTSDQTSFLEIGIPSVQLFATAHPDFHRPGDTIDKIDASGLLKVAAILKEATEYLSNRIEPLSVTLTTQSAGSQTRSDTYSERQVRIGTIPDFTYQKPGMKLEGVSPNSPAEKSGLKKGDIIIAINGKNVKNIADMAAILSTIKPGETIIIDFQRGNKLKQTQAIAEAR